MDGEGVAVEEEVGIGGLEFEVLDLRASIVAA